MTNNRATTAWINSRAAGWQSFALTVANLSRQRHASLAEALTAVDSYRNLARDLAGVRRLAPGTRVCQSFSRRRVPRRTFKKGVDRRGNDGRNGKLDDNREAQPG